MRYLTTEQIKTYCRNEIPTIDDEWIEIAGDYAEQFLDNSCQRRFMTAETASPRLYTPTDLSVLRIHDCTTVTAVSNNGTATTDFQLEPVNGLTWDGETVPYTKVRLNAGRNWYMDDERATVTVTGTWGWAAIPDQIVQAALIVAKDVIANRDDVKLGILGFTDVGGVSARTNTFVRDTINHYRRVEAFGIA